MIGPVLYLELLLGSRRGRLLFLRRLYTSWLILQFTYFFGLYLYDVWHSMLPPPQGLGRMDLQASGRFAESYLSAFITQQFVLLFLLTPTFVAGAVTDEKSRGTLQHLLTTDVSSWEIVLGKLLGRTAQLVVLALAGLPLLCLMAPFGDFDAYTILALALTALFPLFAVGAASVLASVWARQTRDAVLGLYAAGAVGYLLLWGAQEVGTLLGWSRFAAGLDGLLHYFDPLYIMEPAWAERQDLAALGQRLLMALVVWGGLGSVCLGLAVWRLRTAARRQLENASGARRFWRSGRQRYADEDDPVRWKESAVEGIAPLPILRQIPRPVGLAATVLLTLFFSSYAEFETQAILFVLVASGVVGVRCSGAISGERERQTWEALLLTPLPVRDIIHDKLNGILLATWSYVIAYGVSAVAAVLWMGLSNPKRYLDGLACAGLGLLAVWPAMYFVGSVGIYYSVRSQSSWKSLLATLGVGYVGGLMICTVCAPLVGCGSSVLLGLLVLLVGNSSPSEGFVFLTLSAGTIIGCGAILWSFGKRFLVIAQTRVVGRERTPYWKTGVNCGFAVEQYMTRYESRHA